MAENKQAAQIANDALAPVLAEIARQQAEEKQRAMQAQATAGAGAQGLASVLQGIAPRTEQTYQNAAGSTGALAKGFSDAFAAASNGSASDLNEFLAKQGSPQQVQGAGQAGADVLFGLGGYIPASSLLREGAAFTSAAQQLPNYALGRGQMEQQGIRAGSADALKKLSQQRIDTKGKYGGIYQDALSKIEEGKRQDRSIDIQEQFLLLQQGKAQGVYIDPTTGQKSLTPGYTQAADGTIVPPGYSYTPQGGFKEIPAPGSAGDPVVIAKGKAAARAAAIAKRNDATVTALDGATDIVESKLKPGFQENIVGQEPVVIRKQKVGKTERDVYAKKGGGETFNHAEAVTRPIYAKTPIPKPQYEATKRQVVKYLRTHLGRYGYKQHEFRRMADELLADYYQIVGGEAPNPTKKRPGSVYKPNGRG